MKTLKHCLPALLGTIVLSLFLSLPAAGAVEPPARRPNIVLVMTDDQGYGDVGAHGNLIIQTPNLDKLWAECVRMTNFHVDPTCAPTRSAIMTGRNSGRNGVWHTIMGRSLLRANETTTADVFRAGGYKTGMFGKWHLGDTYPFRPQDRGFDTVFCHGGGGVCQTPDYFGNDYFDDTYYKGKDRTPVKMEGYCTDIWFDATMDFIEENKDRPFFAYLATNAPHSPFNVAEKYSKLYKDNPHVPNAAFWGMITNADENMGRLRAKLDELKLTDNTILIFMTDNGTAAGYKNDNCGYNAGMRGKKGSEYDGGHRVPCFIYWPAGGLTGGRDIDRIAAHLDLLPTFIEICGLPAPEGVKFDGKSLAPLLLDKNVKWPDRKIVVESQRIDHPQKWRKCAVMTDRWRLVNGKELYDMPADPGQKNNVAADHPEVIKELSEHYEQWWADVSKTHDVYARIVLGNDAENPATLTCHDWHTGSVPWNHNHIRSGVLSNGPWFVRVDQDGTYEIELRRWPREAAGPLGGSLKIRPTMAKIAIGGVEAEKAIDPDKDESVTFTLELKAGETTLQSWLVDEKKDKSLGAYYAYVKRVN